MERNHLHKLKSLSGDDEDGTEDYHVMKAQLFAYKQLLTFSKFYLGDILH